MIEDPETASSHLLVASYPNQTEAKAAHNELENFFALHMEQRIGPMVGDDYNPDFRTQAQLDFAQKNNITWASGELFRGDFLQYSNPILGLYKNQLALYNGSGLAMPEIEDYLEKTSGDKITKDQNLPNITVTIPMDDSIPLQELSANIKEYIRLRRLDVSLIGPWSNKEAEPFLNLEFPGIREVIFYQDQELMIFNTPIDFDELDDLIEFLNSYTSGKHHIAFCNNHTARELEPINVLNRFCPDCRTPTLGYLPNDDNNNQSGHGFCNACGGMYSLKTLEHRAGLNFFPGSDFICIEGQGKTIMLVDLYGSIYSLTEENNLQEVFQDEDAGLYNLVVLSESIALAGGFESCLMRTRDGGNNWEKMTPPMDVDVANLRASRSGTLFFSGEGRTVKSMDEGDTWQVARNDYDHIYTADNVTFFSLGMQGNINRSDDNCSDWSACESDTDESLRSMILFDETRGIVVGNNSTFLRTEDGGLTWNNMHLKSTGMFRSMKLSPEGFACVLNFGNQILLFEDDGETVRHIDIDFSREIKDFLPLAGRRLLLVTEDGVLINYQLP